MVLHTPVIPAHSKLRQEDHGFEISLDYKKKKSFSKEKLETPEGMPAGSPGLSAWQPV